MYQVDYQLLLEEIHYFLKQESINSLKKFKHLFSIIIPVFNCWTSDDIADVNESAAIRRSVRRDFVCWLIDGDSLRFVSEIILKNNTLKKREF